MIAISRGVHFLCEQPSSSVMLNFPYMIFLATIIHPVQWRRVRLPMSQFSEIFTCIVRTIIALLVLCTNDIINAFFGLSPMGAYGHTSVKPTVLFGTMPEPCGSAMPCVYSTYMRLRPYIDDFKRKLTKRDRRRINKNKAIKKFQTVRKTISKKSNKVQVQLV